MDNEPSLTDELKKAIEGVNELKRKTSPEGRAERFKYDVEDYLHSKHKDVLADFEIQEIAAYCAYAFIIRMSDALLERDKEWGDYCKKTNDWWRKEFEKYAR